MPTENCTPTQDAYTAVCDLQMLPSTGSDTLLLVAAGAALLLVGLLARRWGQE